MEFKPEELIERELEIAGYLIQDLSFKAIAQRTALSKKIITVHIRNMMQKLKADDMRALVKLLKSIKNQSSNRDSIGPRHGHMR